MKAVVKLFGGMSSSKEFPKNEKGDILVEFYEPITMGELIEHLSLNKKPFIVVVNGIIVNDLSFQLKDAYEIGLFPPIAGGDKFCQLN